MLWYGRSPVGVATCTTAWNKVPRDYHMIGLFSSMPGSCWCGYSRVMVLLEMVDTKLVSSVSLLCMKFFESFLIRMKFFESFLMCMKFFDRPKGIQGFVCISCVYTSDGPWRQVRSGDTHICLPLMGTMKDFGKLSDQWG